ncbi:MAG: ATP-binding protein [Chitinophagaceae bacterium]|nr:ATP-binding protein [Chitinophagaceae bacterium]
MVKKIVIIGPESTGKSTLCKQLAEHYNTLWCPEFAREYLLEHGTNYTFDDLLTIAKGQIVLEESYESKVISQKLKTKIQQEITNKKHPTLFLDTDMIVMKVWCEYVFGKCHDFILEEMKTRKYDLYLLCNIDLPWVRDELREYPDEKPRQELFAIYKNILEHQSTPWQLISGIGNERLQNAIKAVDYFMGYNPLH